MKVKYLADACGVRRVALLITLLSIVAVVAACAPEEPMLPEEGEITLSLSSPVFQDGENIPSKYTCDGQDTSPPLVWGEPASGTRAFALIMDDLDAPSGAFTHWVLFNWPADSSELAEAIPTEDQPANGALQGKNDFGRIGYGGPCPPPGPAHRYRFRLYALDEPLDLTAGASKKQVLDAMDGHILAQGQLIGTYQR